MMTVEIKGSSLLHDALLRQRPVLINAVEKAVREIVTPKRISSLSAKRTSSIRVGAVGSKACAVCGKGSCKRKDKWPAPVWLLLDFNSGDKPLYVRAALCMSCTKRLAQQLDAVIEKIESKYKGRMNG